MADKPSKSARKREHLALQALGEQLIDLTESELLEIPLPEDLREAIIAARSITSRSALRRQRQLVGKLMARADADPIRAAFAGLRKSERMEKAVFHESERWRDRIAREGAGAVAEFTERLGFESAPVLAAAKDYAASHDDATRKRSGRRLFRAIHAELSRCGQ